VYFDDLTLSCVDAPWTWRSSSTGLPEPQLVRSAVSRRSRYAPAPYGQQRHRRRVDRLNGTVAVDTTWRRVSVENRRRVAVGRFRASDVLLAVPPGGCGHRSVSGLISGTCIRRERRRSVRPRRVRNPQEHDRVAAGLSLAIRLGDDDDASSATVAILSS
jgi:hypothetical protein